jgi:hypothetical protein
LGWVNAAWTGVKTLIPTPGVEEDLDHQGLGQEAQDAERDVPAVGAAVGRRLGE